MVLKGRLAIVELVDNAAKGPKISFGWTVIFFDQFGRKVTENKSKCTSKNPQRLSAFTFCVEIIIHHVIFQSPALKYFLIFISCFIYVPWKNLRLAYTWKFKPYRNQSISSAQYSKAWYFTAKSKKITTLMSLWTTPTEWIYYKMFTISAI